MRFFFLFLSVFIFFTSCKDNTVKEGLQPNSNFNTITVDSLYSLTLPKYMEAMTNLHSQASLQYGSHYKDTYTVVINENKDNFIGYFHEIRRYNENLSVIQNYAAAQVNYFKESMNAYKIEHYNLSKINNYNAHQFRVEQKINDFNMAYMIAYIETDDDLFMIMSWTRLEKFDQLEDTFTNINKSFKHIQNNLK